MINEFGFVGAVGSAVGERRTVRYRDANFQAMSRAGSEVISYWQFFVNEEKLEKFYGSWMVGSGRGRRCGSTRPLSEEFGEDCIIIWDEQFCTRVT